MKPVNDYGRVLWVAGHPIKHTLSPAIHNGAFEQADLPHRYFAMDVPEGDVMRFLDVFQSVGALGANFTLPLKEALLDHVDHRHNAVDRLGAANTLYRRDNQLWLDNTDVYGFEQLIRPWRDRAENEPVLLLGAGGAARACLYALAEWGCPNVFLWNRTKDRARQLRNEGFETDVSCLSDEELESGTFEAGIAVNATSLGLEDGDPSPLPRSAVSGDMVGVDLIYHRETAFMKTVNEAGGTAVGGLTMLVEQAARAWERWVGETPDTDVMEEAAREEMASS